MNWIREGKTILDYVGCRKRKTGTKKGNLIFYERIITTVVSTWDLKDK